MFSRKERDEELRTHWPLGNLGKGRRRQSVPLLPLPAVGQVRGLGPRGPLDLPSFRKA